VVANTHRILNLLNRYDVRATFFVLGWVASRFPQLVKDIHGDGHEIASHGYWHHLVSTRHRTNSARICADRRDTLQHITGSSVSAYRAPSFSITRARCGPWKFLSRKAFRSTRAFSRSS